MTAGAHELTETQESRQVGRRRIRFLASRSKRLAMAGLARALFHSGLLELHRRRAMRGSALVLLYHRIVDDLRAVIDCSPSGITVDTKSFDEQMAYLKSRYRLVSLAELVADLSSGLRLHDGLCAVTFDDGWRDNYTHAFPILRKHAIPSTIFLTTNFITTNFIRGDRWFWEYRLEQALGLVVQRQAERALSDSDDAAVRETLASVNLSRVIGMNVQALRRVIPTTVTALRSRSSKDRDIVVNALERLLQMPSLQQPRQFMNWDEIREMDAAGVEFGAHTLSHINLERCGLDSAAAEIAGSKSAIEHSLLRPCSFFAYPYGKHTPRVRALVAAAGFSGAFTTNLGLVTAGCDPLRLNRIDIHASLAPHLPIFACRAVRLFQIY